MKKILTLFAAFLLPLQCLWSAPRSQEQMVQLARQALNQQRQGRHQAPSMAPLQVLRSNQQLQVIGHAEGGFAVISVDDAVPAVLGVSLSATTEGQNPNFEWWLTATSEALYAAARSGAPLKVTKPDPTLFPTQVEPMVTSKWYQEAPYNNMCPVFRGSVRCLTGCVATSMAQILNYHKMPAHGQGQRTIYYPKGRTSGEAVTADFENDYYDWDNMLDIYTPGSYTQQQADAVALLMRDCGVAANMEYGGPDEGSGAYSDDAAKGLRDYFGFQEAQCLERDRYSEPEWMNIIYRELSQNGPLYYGGADLYMGGHAFLFDGYDEQGRVSVNWGWEGDADGFFLISHLNPRGYSFGYGQDMIIGVAGGTRVKERAESIVTDEGGQLSQLLSDPEAEGIITSLTIEGPVNGADLEYIRSLAVEGGQDEAVRRGLRMLDLTKATFADNTLPEGALRGCTTLARLRLPETLTAIGGEALSGCTALLELRILSKKVPQLTGTGVFEGMPFGRASLYVLQGMKAQYAQAEQWSSFGDSHIFQMGISVSASNAVRTYGELNPQFTYTVKGGTIKGTPALSCEATRTSPAGRYPVRVSEGTVVNSEAVNFVDGFLLVKKAEATATVANVERFEGEENPPFTLIYEGLVAHDVEPVWTVQPDITTTATVRSKPGEYMIYVRSGEAESYNMVFLPGKLTVKARPSAISDVTTAADRQAPAYNLQGQRMQSARRGISIVGGRKVVR